MQGNALGFEWRTTPLVGVGQRDSYLHDGRAATLRDAVKAHGGEAEIVRNRFFNLKEADQQAIMDFVESFERRIASSKRLGSDIGTANSCQLFGVEAQISSARWHFRVIISSR